MQQTVSTPDEIHADQTFAAELKRIRDQEGISFKELAEQVGCSRSVISNYVNQGMRLRPDIEQRLRDIVRGINAKDDKENDSLYPKMHKRAFKQEITLYETVEYKEAIGWCSYVFAKRKMGVLVGHPGSGKTTILRNFAEMQPGVTLIEAWPTMRMGDLLNAISRAIGLSNTGGNNYQRAQTLISALRGRKDVLIAIDEAEYLGKWDVDKFEILRKIWDATGTPIILCGTPRLEELLTRGTGRNNLAQLYRRKVELKLRGATAGETRAILKDYDVTSDVSDALAKTAADVRHGGFGCFVELLELCLEAAEGGQITAEILQGAMKYKLMY